MNIVFTTLALALELVATPAFRRDYYLFEVQSLRTGGTVISALYIFELIYRLKMRLPLIAHHFLTIIAISFTVTCFEYTEDPSFIGSAVIWLFQATTEQPTFVGLLGSNILKFAAIQTFVVKTASAIGIIVYWGVYQNRTYQPIDKAWTAMVFIIAIGLLLTQIWGSWVTYSIGRHISVDRQLPTSRDLYNKSNLAIYQTVVHRGTGMKRTLSALTTRTTDESATSAVVPPVPPIPAGEKGDALPKSSSGSIDFCVSDVAGSADGSKNSRYSEKTAVAE
ncbi:hypothetical protein P7C73_g2064, partial [Tremellales sp. Uapishka_1]